MAKKTQLSTIAVSGRRYTFAAKRVYSIVDIDWHVKCLQITAAKWHIGHARLTHLAPGATPGRHLQFVPKFIVYSTDIDWHLLQGQPQLTVDIHWNLARRKISTQLSLIAVPGRRYTIGNKIPSLQMSTAWSIFNRVAEDLAWHIYEATAISADIKWHIAPDAATVFYCVEAIDFDFKVVETGFRNAVIKLMSNFDAKSINFSLDVGDTNFSMQSHDFEASSDLVLIDFHEDVVETEFTNIITGPVFVFKAPSTDFVFEINKPCFEFEVSGREAG